MKAVLLLLISVSVADDSKLSCGAATTAAFLHLEGQTFDTGVLSAELPDSPNGHSINDLVAVLALSRPNISAEPGATFTWQGDLQTERTENGFMRARQGFVLTVTAGNNDSLATKSFQASWPANGPQPIRWSVTLESQPTYRLEPRALVWKPTEEGVKQLVLTSEEASLSTRSIVVEGDVKYEIRKSTVDDKQIVIDVECNRRDRGRAGTLKVQVSGTQFVVPVYRLGGDA